MINLSTKGLCDWIRSLEDELGTERFHVARVVEQEQLTGAMFLELTQEELCSLTLSHEASDVLQYIKEDLIGDSDTRREEDEFTAAATEAEALSRNKAYANLDECLRSRLEVADSLARDRGVGSIYGEFVSLGYTQFRQSGKSELHPVGPHNVKFPLRRRVLLKRPHHQALRMHFVARSGDPDATHTETFIPSPAVDEFQIGRAISGGTNDIRIAGPLHLDSHGKVCGPVSRFACRVLCDRLPPYRIFVESGGFNDAGHLTVLALDGSNDDGVPNYGVSLYRPNEGVWYTVTVRGRLIRCGDATPAVLPPTGAAELEDGSILCVMGMCLLFRRPLDPCVNNAKCHPSVVVSALNALHPTCPVHLHQLTFTHTSYSIRLKEARQVMYKGGGWSSSGALLPSAQAQDGVIDASRQPYVFSQCGHVFGYNAALEGRCAMCRTPGPYSPLSIPFEPTISGTSVACMPTHVFSCGHASSLSVCEYWSQVSLPDITNQGAPFRPSCPFCALPLNSAKPYCKLLIHHDSAVSLHTHIDHAEEKRQHRDG